MNKIVFLNGMENIYLGDDLMWLKRLLSKTKKKLKNCKYERIITDYMKVINPCDMVEIEKPLFDKSHWGKEEDYKLYLENIQPLIEEYELTKTIHTLKYNSLADVKKNRDEQNRLNHFNNSFLSAANWINVEKMLNGKYRITTNGFHRMYVAKKYNLKLLVHVAQEVVEKI